MAATAAEARPLLRPPFSAVGEHVCTPPLACLPASQLANVLYSARCRLPPPTSHIDIPCCHHHDDTLMVCYAVLTCTILTVMGHVGPSTAISLMARHGIEMKLAGCDCRSRGVL